MFKGKTIYQPAGKAKEYSNWACNIFTGCSNDCRYCYCKRGVLSKVAGQTEVRFKKGLDENNWYATFLKEVTEHADEIRRDGGLFFSFTTDPCLPETLAYTVMCVRYAAKLKIPCRILTKRVDWIPGYYYNGNVIAFEHLKDPKVKPYVSIGISFSGYPEVEPNASSEEERIQALAELNAAGFKTFVSFEPILYLASVYTLTCTLLPYVDEFWYRLLSGNACKTAMYNDKTELKNNLQAFVKEAGQMLEEWDKTVLWKQSIKQAII